LNDTGYIFEIVLKSIDSCFIDNKYCKSLRPNIAKTNSLDYMKRIKEHAKRKREKTACHAPELVEFEFGEELNGE